MFNCHNNNARLHYSRDKSAMQRTCVCNGCTWRTNTHCWALMFETWDSHWGREPAYDVQNTHTHTHCTELCHRPKSYRALVRDRHGGFYIIISHADFNASSCVITSYLVSGVFLLFCFSSLSLSFLYIWKCDSGTFIMTTRDDDVTVTHTTEVSCK